MIINLPPRHLKSHLASVAFPAWCLGHDPSAQILCVSYVQDLADKLSRDCRHILTSNWYRQLFATPPLGSTASDVRIRDHLSGLPARHLGRRRADRAGADLIIIDDPLKPEEALLQSQRQAANEWYDHTLYSRLNDTRTGSIS